MQGLTGIQSPHGLRGARGVDGLPGPIGLRGATGLIQGPRVRAAVEAIQGDVDMSNEIVGAAYVLRQARAEHVERSFVPLSLSIYRQCSISRLTQNPARYCLDHMGTNLQICSHNCIFTRLCSRTQEAPTFMEHKGHVDRHSLKTCWK